MRPESATAEIARISDNLRLLFGSSQQGEELHRLCETATADIRSIATHRQLQTTVVAVIGSKKAGKSWLCRRLLKNHDERERVKSGELARSATTRALWIGPNAPANLDLACESHIPVLQSHMQDLGHPYMVVDLPGFNDATVPQREAALRIAYASTVRILVVSIGALDIESQFEYLKQSDGTVILPVVVDEFYPSALRDGQASLSKFMNDLRQRCPSAIVREPIVVPHVERSVGDRLESETIADSEIHRATGEALSCERPDPSVAVAQRFETFKHALADSISPTLARIQPTYEALAAEESALVTQLVGQILGTDEQVAVGIRMKMRMLTVSRTPAGFFPYRTLLGVFALTAGAWDRLAFALAGSLPSLAFLAIQTSRNIKDLGKSLEEAKNALRRRLETMAQDKLDSVNDIFVRSIRNSFPEAHALTSSRAADTTVVGLDTVTEKSGEIFTSTIARFAPSRLLVLFWGGLGTLAFFGLGIGPAVAIYREFLDVYLAVFQQGKAITWEAFPTPSGSMIASTLLLMLIPTLLCALITIAKAAPRKNVLAGMDHVKASHAALVREVSETKAVRLVSKDPVREAIRFLLDLIAKRQPADFSQS